MSSFIFRHLQVYFSGGVRIEFRFYSMKFISKIKNYSILLDQEDQFLIRLIKILQASYNQDHLRVRTGFEL